MTAKIEYCQWVMENKTASEALALVGRVLAGEIVTGFVFTPENACFCMLRGSGMIFGCDETAEGKPIDPGSVFEYRLFGPKYEARWERTSGPKGDLRICSDTSAGGNAEQFKQLDYAETSKDIVPNPITRDHCYLLWGEPAGEASHGRTRLTSARIGTLWAPVDSKGRRVVLTAREYFASQKYGNAVFIGERLTGLQAAADEAEKTGASQ